MAQNGPLEGVEKDVNVQVDSQMPASGEDARKAARKGGEDGRKRNGGTPPTRRKGDVQYSVAARRQMSLSALRSATVSPEAASES